MSAPGEILEVLGNNTYLADVEGKGQTHVSGDVLSKLKDVATTQQQQHEASGDEPSVDREQMEDDNVSVVTVSSIDTELMADVPVERGHGQIVPDVGQGVGQVRRRRRRRNAEMLENNQVI